MPLYNETTTTESVTKTTYTRANLVTIDNALNQTPFITYVEENVEKIGDTQKRAGSAGSVSEFLTSENVGETFNVLDLSTGEVSRQATYGEVQALIYSLYFYIATKRDAAGN